MCMAVIIRGERIPTLAATKQVSKSSVAVQLLSTGYNSDGEGHTALSKKVIEKI